MDHARKRIIVPAAILMSLLLAPMLTACGNPVEGILNQVTGGDVDLGGSTIPEDFPKEVPVVAGAVVFGAGIGNGDGKVWNVTIQVSDGNALEGIAAQLTSAGFEPVGDGTVSGDANAGTFAKEPYHVIVLVSDDDKGGFIANYTVTYVKPGS